MNSIKFKYSSSNFTPAFQNKHQNDFYFIFNKTMIGVGFLVGFCLKKKQILSCYFDIISKHFIYDFF